MIKWFCLIFPINYPHFLEMIIEAFSWWVNHPPHGSSMGGSLLNLLSGCSYWAEKDVKKNKRHFLEHQQTNWNCFCNLPNLPIIFLSGLAIARRVCCLISRCAHNIQPYSTNAQCSPCLGLEQHHLSVMYIKKTSANPAWLSEFCWSDWVFK